MSFGKLANSYPELSRPLRVAVAGLGRMGKIHAQHMRELAQATGACELVAVTTSIPEQAEEFITQTVAAIAVFPSIEELAAARICDATIIATNTAFHRQHAQLMLSTGQRVFLEKPLTGTLDGDREFASYLQRVHPRGVMLGFQRRFDAPLQFAKRLLDAGAIGRLFKIYSALEDSGPAPNGFYSPGILSDMGIHNVDEILWLSGRFPQSAMVVGSRIHGHRLTTCVEDFDDALLLLDFGGSQGDEMIAQVQVGRNHVSGYRGETFLYGEEGLIRIGFFNGNPQEVLVEVYGRRGSTAPITSRSFATRKYTEQLPEFVDRYGEAYKEELHVFVRCCLDGADFPVTHLDALRAQEVIDAGMRAVFSKDRMAAIACDVPASATGEGA